MLALCPRLRYAEDTRGGTSFVGVSSSSLDKPVEDSAPLRSVTAGFVVAPPGPHPTGKATSRGVSLAAGGLLSRSSGRSTMVNTGPTSSRSSGSSGSQSPSSTHRQGRRSGLFSGAPLTTPGRHAPYYKVPASPLRLEYGRPESFFIDKVPDVDLTGKELIPDRERPIYPEVTSIWVVCGFQSEGTIVQSSSAPDVSRGFGTPPGSVKAPGAFWQSVCEDFDKDGESHRLSGANKLMLQRDMSLLYANPSGAPYLCFWASRRTCVCSVCSERGYPLAIRD